MLASNWNSSASLRTASLSDRISASLHAPDQRFRYQADTGNNQQDQYRTPKIDLAEPPIKSNTGPRADQHCRERQHPKQPKLHIEDGVTGERQNTQRDQLQDQNIGLS